MSGPSTAGPARRDAYVQWRQRLSDQHAERRERDSAPAEEAPNPWDPALLFAPAASGAATVEPPAPAPIDEPPARTIDLRSVDDALEALTPSRRPAAPAAPADAAREPARDPRGGVDVRPPRSMTGPAPRRDVATEPARPAARLEPNVPVAPVAPVRRAVPAAAASAAAASATAAPLGDALRELNQQRLDGRISEEQFKARKADLFERSARA